MTKTNVRIRFAKTGRASFLGHLELMDAMRRAARRADLPLRYTEGFHPRPVLNLGRALSVGIESECEFMDVGLSEAMDLQEVCTRLNAVVPHGVQVHEAHLITEVTPPLDGGIVATRFEVNLVDAEAYRAKLAAYATAVAWPVTMTRRDKVAQIDLKTALTELAMIDSSVLGTTLSHAGPSMGIFDMLKALFDLTDAEARALYVRKVAVEFKS